MTGQTVAQVLAPGSALTPPVATFRFLAEQGWNVHLLCEFVDPDALDGISGLPTELTVGAVHPPPEALRASRRAETARISRRLLRELGRRPLAGARALRLYGLPTPAWLWQRYFDALLFALQPQLVHFHSTESLLKRRPLLSQLRAKVAVSLDWEVLPPLEANGSDSWREMLEVADGFCFPDEIVRERALARGLPADRPWIVGSAGLEHLPPDASSDRVRLLSIGDLSWRQGYEHALHAVRLLLDRGVDCEYRLVGGGEFLGALRFARSQLDLEDHVELAGSRAPNGIADDFLWADVFLHPAVAEVPLHYVAEAAAFGLPAVATIDELPGGPRGHRILTVPRRDPWAIADALAAAASTHNGQLRTTGQSERSLDVRLHELDQLYRALLAAH